MRLVLLRLRCAAFVQRYDSSRPGRERQEERPSIHAARGYKRIRPDLGTRADRQISNSAPGEAATTIPSNVVAASAAATSREAHGGMCVTMSRSTPARAAC